MKKILSIVLLLTIGINCFAQKKYITLKFEPNLSRDNYVTLSGAIPSSMKKSYSYKDFNGGAFTYDYEWIGDLLNMLANEGFTVEHTNTYGNSSNNNYILYLLSKPSGTTTHAKSIEIDKSNEDEPETIIGKSVLLS